MRSRRLKRSRSLSFGAQKQQERGLPLPRFARSPHLPHHQAEIERTGMHDQPFENVVSSAQVDSPHASGVVQVGEAAFHQLASLLLQSLTPLAVHPPPVRIHQWLIAFSAFPLPSPPLRFGDVASHAFPLQLLQDRSAMVAAIAHQLLHAPLVHFPHRRLRLA
jgi:hypothetical protein